MQNIWTINGASPESQNLGSIQLKIITQSADLVTLTQTTAYDADPTFAYGETVTIHRDGAQWFKGTCISIARHGSGASERIDYQIAGPWWQLTKVIYQQQFTRFVSGVTATPTLAKLILGTDDAGARLNSGQVITAVVNYAASALGASALFQLGTVAPATQMPYEELNALSCADVISRVLRWNPDVVAYFDYSSTPPTLHFKTRASLDALSLDIADVVISKNSVNPRNDLQIDGVVIQFERTDTVDGNKQNIIITDSAGTITDPLKTLYLYFDLQGASVSFIRQKVVSETISESSGTWWQKKHAKLQGATSISVASATKTALDDAAENDGTAYSKELVSGSIAEWMTGVGVNTQIVQATVIYTKDGAKKTETLRLSLQGTNANSSTYSSVGSETPAEPTPTGLAAAILSSLVNLQYQGAVTLTESEAGGVSHINKKLNILGGRTEWASMAAQIYSATYSLDSGITQINFGPAKHLGATDLFQLFRNVRNRQGGSGSVRAQIGGTSDLPTRSANTSTADDGGGAGPEAFRIYWADGLSTVVDFSTAIATRDSDSPEDEWGIFFGISNLAHTKTITYGEGLDINDDTGTDQTQWYLPIYGDGKLLTTGGVYRAETFCASSKPVTGLVKIG